VVHLQGFLFFGSAETILNEVREQISHAPRTAALLLDIRLVLGIDSTALESLNRLQRFLVDRNVFVAFTSVAHPPPSTSRRHSLSSWSLHFPHVSVLQHIRFYFRQTGA
jgi:MFS superfamily sulfate permease-like transporter